MNTMIALLWTRRFGKATTLAREGDTSRNREVRVRNNAGSGYFGSVQDMCLYGFATVGLGLASSC